MSKKMAVQALGRALNRGAIGEGRVAHYASLIRRGQIDAASIDRLADPQRPHGLTGGDEDGDEDGLGEFAGLYPPRTREEATARHEAAQLAAAARRDANDGDLTDEEWARIFGAPPPED